ncbi:MAG: hypothetical protein P8I59_10905, partial [Pseudomonadales bacterium]|nr:hypothetical protein [Pseudomonadales bacterium]
MHKNVLAADSQVTKITVGFAIKLPCNDLNDTSQGQTSLRSPSWRSSKTHLLLKPCLAPLA